MRLRPNPYLLAGSLHLLGILLLAHRAREEPDSQIAEPMFVEGPALELELVVEEAPRPRRSPGRASLGRHSAPPSMIAPPQRRASRTAKVELAETGAREVDRPPEPQPERPPERVDGWSAERPEADDFGLSLDTRWRLSVTADASKKRPIDDADWVANELDQHDKELGLGHPELQTVVAAVNGAARLMPTSHESKAVVRVQLGPSGEVLSVDTSAVSGGREEWIGLTDVVKETLGDTVTLGKRAEGRGASILVEVSAHHVYPHGTAKQLTFEDCSDVPKIVHTDENGKPLMQTFAFGLRFDIGSWGANKQISVRTRGSVEVLRAPEVQAASGPGPRR